VSRSGCRSTACGTSSSLRHAITPFAIRSDPNNPDDPETIVRLVGEVVRVSVETVKIVAGLPRRFAADSGIQA
jgi:hypothetical protein